MRRLVFVESNTTGSGMQALRTARALGVVPVLLTGSPDRYPLEPDAAEVVACDTNAMPELRAVLARFPRDELAGITTTSEFYLTAVAELAEWLGLPGNPPDAIRACRDKAAMRRVLAAAGLTQPRFATVDSAEAVDDAAVGLPCVVKPVADSGSHLVRVCMTAAEAREHVDRVLAERTNVRGQQAAGHALVEEFLPGPEFSVEMFSWAGRTHCVGITAKELTGFPHCVERQHLYPAALADTGQLVRYAVRVLAAAGVTHGATHLEIRLGRNGPALVEINARPAGGMIPTLIQLVDGVDVVAEHLRACLGRAPMLPDGHTGCAGIRFLTATHAGRLIGVTGASKARQVPGVVRVEVTARDGAPVAPPQDSYDRLGFVIAKGRDHDEVTTTLAAACDRLRVEVRPEHLVSTGGGT